MKQLLITLATFILFYNYANSQNLVDSQLINSIRTSIKPQYTNWVIFSNGTYFVITADSSTPNLKTKAIEILKEIGNDDGNKLDKSNFVINLEDVKGWIVNSSFDGLYTYVGSEELKKTGTENPKDVDIVLYAMGKRKKDITNLKIIFENY